MNPMTWTPLTPLTPPPADEAGAIRYIFNSCSRLFHKGLIHFYPKVISHDP